MAWLAHPVTYYALLALGLAACLYLFVSMKCEIAALRRSADRDRQGAAARIEELEALVKGGDESRKQAALPGTNLNKRAQALRMYRRGQSADQIASVLRLPPDEVDLLLNLHNAVSGDLAGRATELRSSSS